MNLNLREKLRIEIPNSRARYAIHQIVNKKDENIEIVLDSVNGNVLKSIFENRDEIKKSNSVKKYLGSNKYNELIKLLDRDDVFYYINTMTNHYDVWGNFEYRDYDTECYLSNNLVRVFTGSLKDFCEKIEKAYVLTKGEIDVSAKDKKIRTIIKKIIIFEKKCKNKDFRSKIVKEFFAFLQENKKIIIEESRKWALNNEIFSLSIVERKYRNVLNNNYNIFFSEKKMKKELVKLLKS